MEAQPVREQECCLDGEHVCKYGEKGDEEIFSRLVRHSGVMVVVKVLLGMTVRIVIVALCGNARRKAAYPNISCSTSWKMMCPIVMCPSWIRWVSSDGTTIARSTRSLDVPPSFPSRPMVTSPFSRAF